MSRGELFYRLVQQAVAIEAVTVDKILHPEKKRAWKIPPRKASRRKGVEKENECHSSNEAGNWHIVAMLNSLLAHEAKYRGDSTTRCGKLKGIS